MINLNINTTKYMCYRLNQYKKTFYLMWLQFVIASKYCKELNLPARQCAITWPDDR